MTKLTDAGKVYKQFEAAFPQVSAYAVIRDGKPMAKVALKFAKSGLSTCAYVHWIGLPMVRGVANGGGYDKASAACSIAMGKTRDPLDIGKRDDVHLWDLFRSTLAKDDGQHWDNRLRAAGFDVFQVV